MKPKSKIRRMDPRFKKPFVKKEKKPAAAPAAAPDAKPKKTYPILRGMHDILPQDEKYWRHVTATAQRLADHFLYSRLDVPIVEEASLFIRSVGRGTDIVDKEMYVFEDRDGTKVGLRPEATAGMARAYIGNGLWNQPQPMKVWTSGPMFRHDRPQSGRYRQFYQLDFETYGLRDACVDAELMLVAYNLYEELGIPVELRVNSIGTPDERNRYKTELVNFYRSKRSYICEDCRTRLTRNPLRVLDCKNEQCQTVREEAPHLLDWLGEASKEHFMKVLEYLDELAVPYTLAPFLVRGLDYYTDTVFEIYPIKPADKGAETSAAAPAEEGVPAEEKIAEEKVEEKEEKPDKPETAQAALGGGGRYDLLLEELGGRPTPAAGFAIGLERTVMLLKEAERRKTLTVPGPRVDFFFAQLGEGAKRRMLQMLNGLRRSGLAVGYNFFKTSLKAQLEQANAAGVSYVVILGQKEVQDGTVIIRDMESGVQEIIDQKKIEGVLRKKLGTV